jgi:hypothetical protein
MATGRERLREDVRAEVARRGPLWLVEQLNPGRATKNVKEDSLLAACWWHADDHPSCRVRRAPDTGNVQAVCHCGGKGDCFQIAAAEWGLTSSDSDFVKVLDRLADLVGIDWASYPFGETGGPTARAAAVPRANPAPAGDGAPRATTARTGAAAPAPADKKPAASRDASWKQLAPVDADAWEFLRARGIEEAAPLCRSVPPSGGPKALYGANLAVALKDIDGRIVAIQGRDLTNRIDPVTGKSIHEFRVDGSTKAGVFGEPQRLKEPAVEWVILCEGLTDYLAACVAIGERPKTVVLGIAGVENAEYVKQLPLAGKRVVFAFDADEAGDKCANDLFAALAPTGARCTRARPTAGTGSRADLCGMLAAGQDLLRFLAHPKAMRRFKPNVVSTNAAEHLAGGLERRREEWRRGMPLEFEFLDRVFGGGLFSREILLFGAETGVGKTELLASMGYAIAQAGRRVRLFALEAEVGEISDRLKYREMLARTYTLLAQEGVTPSYQDFVQGDPVLNDIFAAVEDDVNAFLEPRLKNLHVEYRTKNFTIEDFVEIAEDTEIESDVFVLDHVHVVDASNDRDSENKALTKILHSISDLALRIGKPVVLAAHVRKNTDPKRARVIPTLDDFMGTSNVPKIATKAVMLARANKPNEEPRVKPSYPWMVPTFVQVQKIRRDGSRMGTLGLVEFNLRTGRYSNDFQLGRLKGEEFIPTPIAEWPYWATRQLLRPGQENPGKRATASRAAPALTLVHDARAAAAGGDNDE